MPGTQLAGDTAVHLDKQIDWKGFTRVVLVEVENCMCQDCDLQTLKCMNS